MRPVFAIAKSTIRAAFRSHLVLVLLSLLAVTAILLPLVIRGDRTAVGLVQISLTYMLGAIGVLLSLVTVWLGCTMTADEIEGYQIHLVAAKPVSRLGWLTGKYLGIVILQAALLTVSTAAVYGLLQYRLHTGNFGADELAKVKHEVLTGRRRYAAELPNLERIVADELQRRLATGQLPPGMNESMVRSEIRRQMKARLNELPAGERRDWRFTGIPSLLPDQQLTIRYRVYVNKVSNKNQRETGGHWFVKSPQDGQFYALPNRIMSGVHHELYITPEAISADGTVEIAYENRDPAGESVVFQAIDGPFILADASGFAGNYARAVLLMFLQLAFLAILGCAAGANLSAPVAIFGSFSYILIGIVVTAMQPATPEDDMIPAGFVQLLAYYVRKLVSWLTVSVNEFNELPLLTRGQLIEWGHIAGIAINPLLIHGLLLALLGGWALSRRDLALVMRRR